MTPTTTPPIRATRRPSAQALQRRIAQAARQAEFAERAGWACVAALYRRLGADLARIAERRA